MERKQSKGGTHLLSNFKVPNTKAVPVPFSINLSTSLVYTFSASSGSPSTFSSAAYAYLSSQCIKGRSNPVPAWRYCAAWMCRSVYVGRRKEVGGRMVVLSSATKVEADLIGVMEEM